MQRVVIVRSVHLIESFDDLKKAFFGARSADDDDPMMNERGKLRVTKDGLELIDSERYTLSDDLRHRGREFIEWCVEQQIAHGRVDTDSIFE